MKIAKSLSLVFLGICMSISGLSAQEVTFETKLSRNSIGVNENLQVEFVMNENGDNFNPPSFEGFRVVSGPSQSVSRQYINGVSSFSKSYSYFLQPLRKGTLTIGQATVIIDGEEYKTLPVRVQINDAVEKPNDPNNFSYAIDDNIHLVAHVSKGSPYLNEGVLVEYKLYFQNPLSLSNLVEINSPTFSDFWSNNIDIGQVKVNPGGRYNGQSYNEVLWKKVLLFPQKPGRIKLDPLVLSMNISVPTNRRDLFGSRIYNQVQQNISTKPTYLDVKSLPDEGKPAGFSGAVGQFEFEVLLDKDRLSANESLQARVRVNGRGNLGLFSLPDLNTPSNLEVYQPERSESIRIVGTSSRGSVEDRYTVVPRYQGSYPIPSVTFSFFDPVSETYKMIRSLEQAVNVYEGPNQIIGAIDNNNQSIGTNTIAGDTKTFRFISLNTSLEDIKQKEFWFSNLFWILFLSPIGLLIVLILIYKFFFNRPVDREVEQRKAINRLAKKYLSTAKKQMADSTAFYTALEKALHNFLKAKLKLETSEFSKDRINTLLESRAVSSDSVNEFIGLLSICEVARYTPTSKVDMRDDYFKASRVISKLDKQI